MSPRICWFRSDLRVQDNRALEAALKEGPTLGLFIATPRQWEVHDDAPVKLDFQRRSLVALEAELKLLGITLLYLEVEDFRAIPAALMRLCRALDVEAIHCNREYPLNEVRRDAAVAACCGQGEARVAFHLHEDKLLSLPDTVLTRAGEPFRVFTPYARRARELVVSAPTAELATLAGQYPHARISWEKAAATAGLCSLGDIHWPAPQAHWKNLWPAGEQAGLRALQDFCAQRIGDYQDRRDFPGLNATSRLSPHLRCGSLSSRQCWRAAGSFHDGAGVESWRNELLWRDYYHYVMHHFPHVCRGQAWRDDVGHVQWRRDEGEFDAWCQGRTGIPLVDAAMRQLLATGWMHNRLRMVVAMFLSKSLLMDWRWGEAWFMGHLVDGDFAANNGGWQWSASTGTDAVPYFRIFNPVTQSRRFDPEGSFIRHYVPELAELDDRQIHDPGLFRPPDYPPPIVDLKFGRQRALQAFKKGSE